MAIAFRSGANTAYGSRTNITVTAPAGITNGDILVAMIATGAASAPVPSTPTGWTAFGTDVTDTAGGFTVRLRTFWKRAASESGNYTFNHTSASSAGWIGCYSGAIASGTPLNVTSTNTGFGSTSTGTGITTSAANSFLLWLSTDFADFTNNLTPPSGMTERLDAVVVYAADELRASAGATSNRTMTNNNDGAQGTPWGVRLVELLAATGGGTTDGAGSGSVTFSGTAVGAQTAGAAGAGTVAFSGTAGGAEIAAAVGAGTITFSGSAAGAQIDGATGAGTITFSGAAIGAQIDGAAGAGTITFAGAAGGAQVDGAAGAGTITFAGAGVGSSSSSGTTDGVGSGTISFSGAAVGAQIDGSAGSGSITFSGLAGGAEIAQAVGTGTLAFNGVGVSDAPVVTSTGGGFTHIGRYTRDELEEPEEPAYTTATTETLPVKPPSRKMRKRLAVAQKATIPANDDEEEEAMMLLLAA